MINNNILFAACLTLKLSVYEMVSGCVSVPHPILQIVDDEFCVDVSRRVARHVWRVAAAVIRVSLIT